MGEAIALGLGTIFSSMTLGTAAVIAGAINGALIGAAVGGLTAAVTGGDIGKGMLYGAIGGAVTGGIGAWAAEGFSILDVAVEPVTGVGEAGGQTIGGVSSGVPEGMELTSQTIDAAGKTTNTYTKTSGLFSGENVTQMIGGVLEGAGNYYTAGEEADAAQEDAAAARAFQAAEAEKARAFQAAESEKAFGAQMEQLDKQLASQLDISQANLGEQRRQFDVGKAAELAKLRDAASGRGALTMGSGTATTATFAPKLTGDLLQTGILEEEY